jgi:CMP-N-acetylneuraminate monooxygenase
MTQNESEHVRISLGRREDFRELPAPITIEGQSYFLTETPEGELVLLSARCPHLGGLVEDRGDRFRCPNHGWEFDRATGCALNIARAALDRFPVVDDRGALSVALRRHRTQPAPTSRPHPDVLANVSVRLVSHACLDLQLGAENLLIDPWIEGTAFLGAWVHYPTSPVRLEELRPSVLVVTHEHSDHLNPRSLARFPRRTPILFPDFPNGRVARKIEALGFENRRAMRFGEPVLLESGVRITCFEPKSLWNDSILLVEYAGFRLLNLNDAGLNPRLAQIIGPVDVVSAAFSPVASGYPQTWTHLSPDAQATIMEDARRGNLAMLKEAVRLYGAQSLLPFASHFALWHPSHETFTRRMLKNTIDDVVEYFEDQQVDVVDLMPGETWHPHDGRIDRVFQNRRRLYESDTILRFAERHFTPDLFEIQHPADVPLDPGSVVRYLEQLNDVPEIAFCEDVVVRFRATVPGTSEVDFELWCHVAGGRLTVEDRSPVPPNIGIDVPRNILAAIVRDDLSWDEAHVGYWCRFWRSPDVYHANFWRLLQTPYYRSRDPWVGAARDGSASISSESVIAALLERHGGAADRILRRHGLYCLGCHHSPAETVGAAVRAHGLSDAAGDRLVRELNEALVLTDDRRPVARES